jgi:hypothetical protein
MSAFGNAAFIASETKRTLLVHPNIHNVHTGNIAFELDGNGKFSRQSRDSINRSKIPIDKLLQIGSEVDYEIVRNDSSLWDMDFRIEKCCENTFSVTIEMYKNFIMKHNNSTYIALFRAGYLGRERLFDFHSSIYLLVKKILSNANIELNNSIVLHQRMGDFKSYCQKKVNCYFDFASLEIPLLNLQKKTGAKHLLIMTNGKLDENILRRNNWKLTMPIIMNSTVLNKEFKEDRNALVAIEMAIAVSSRYFIGNIHSSFSTNIAILRQKHHICQNATITIPEMIGSRVKPFSSPHFTDCKRDI